MEETQPETTLARCDANVRVNAATTTCEFAQNVFYEYWTTGGASVEAYSPVSRRTYDVRCRGGSTVVCRASDGAEIRFSAGAVALYDQQQADAYASSHDLGPQSAEDGGGSTGPQVDTGSDDGSGAECDPGYEGACLDPSSYDYDCESGEGDGPDYTGEVTVVGDDPHDLDRDGDGVACEPY